MVPVDDYKSYYLIGLAVFRQALQDARKKGIPQDVKLEAIQWLLWDGYTWLVDYCELDLTAKKYLETVKFQPSEIQEYYDDLQLTNSNGLQPKQIIERIRTIEKLLRNQTFPLVVYEALEEATSELKKLVSVPVVVKINQLEKEKLSC